jgi:hypothetical protein
MLNKSGLIDNFSFEFSYGWVEILNLHPGFSMIGRLLKRDRRRCRIPMMIFNGAALILPFWR